MITAEIAPGWHVYSLTQPPGGPTKTKIELNDSTQFKLIGQFRSQPEPTERVDDQAWVGLTIEEQEGQVTWYAPIELTAGVDPASLAIIGKVRMLACKESCIPVNQDFTARLGAGVPIGELALASGPDTSSDAASATVPASPTTAYQPEGSEVKISARLVPGVARSGGDSRLEITLAPPGHWHIYAYADRDDHPGSKPTLIAFDQLSGFRAARPVTAAVVSTDNSIPEFGPMHFYTGPVTWELPIEIPPGTRPGEYPIGGVIAYQACETRADGLGSCELPKAVKFTANIVVGDVASSAAGRSISHPSRTRRPPRSPRIGRRIGTANPAHRRLRRRRAAILP